MWPVDAKLVPCPSDQGCTVVTLPGRQRSRAQTFQDRMLARKSN